MWHQDRLNTTITVSGEIQGENSISEKKIVLELLPLQLRDVKALGNSRKPCPIIHFPLEAIQSCPVFQLLPYSQRLNIPKLPLFPPVRALSTYASFMRYLVEVGTS